MALKTGQVHNGRAGLFGRRTRTQTQRRFTPEFKTRLVLDVLTGVQSQAEACRQHALSPNLLANWKTALLQRAHTGFQAEAPQTAEQARIAELERVLGRLTLENEILKKASKRLG